MRERLSSELKAAMKAGDKRRVETIRLINAALKDRDIEARTSGDGEPIGDSDIMALLQKMIKSRQESLEIYNRAGRTDLAEREAGEIAIISDYLPRQMSEDETVAAVDNAVAKMDATTIKDMGKVIGALKAEYAGRMDFAKASGLLKARLAK